MVIGRCIFQKLKYYGNISSACVWKCWWSTIEKSPQETSNQRVLANLLAVDFVVCHGDSRSEGINSTILFPCLKLDK